MNVAIPDSLRDFVLSRVAECGFSSIDDYVGRLVLADQQETAQERLEDELSRGLASDRVKATAEDFNQLRNSIRDRYAAKADRR